jgi:hypothetical protein
VALRPTEADAVFVFGTTFVLVQKNGMANLMGEVGGWREWGVLGGLVGG